MLLLSAELYCANRQSDGWRSIVASVRKVFSGQLTEAAMPQGCAGSAKAPDGSTLGGQGQCAGRTDGALPGACVDGVDWWDALDIIGMDAYFVLNGTTVDDIVAQWSEYKSFAKEVSAKHDNKPVVFTEIGYCSGHCSRDHAASEADYEQQARHYEAVFEAFRGEDWFLGAFWWNWNADDGSYAGADDFLSPQWKPAEDVLRKYYRATEPKPMPSAARSQCAGDGKGTC